MYMFKHYLITSPVVVTFGVIAKSVIITPKSTPTPYTSGQKKPLKVLPICTIR